MKKFFVAVALVASLGTSTAFAVPLTNAHTHMTIVADEYVFIELKYVPQAIQDAVAKDYAGNAIKEAHVKTAEDGTKTYKLVLIDNNQSETIVLFNEAGEEVKEEAAK